MKKLSILAVLAVSVFSFSLLPATALAAKPVAGGGAAPAPELVGYDVSYPQCGRKLPTDHYFGVVGVNNGLANGANPCLADQLVWASKAKPGSGQSKYQLYVNTANPGEVISQINTWPTTDYDLNGNRPNNPYQGGCNGSNSSACSWLYGWNRSIYTESVFKSAASSKGLNTNTATYLWWLDVETMNTWQSGSKEALMRNTAAIEGFGAYYQSKGARIGLYSTAVQWAEITGNTVSATSNLNTLPNWRPSGTSLANAKANCSVAPLTPGGFISLTQYVVKNLDHDHSCV
ncbi:MAG: hypothetical protein JWM37_676 [Candidatus Saccharibacteria bacterium]|nr:hypothetical protein [Candidatus Saccharibacteria bacterium]